LAEGLNTEIHGFDSFNFSPYSKVKQSTSNYKHNMFFTAAFALAAASLAMAQDVTISSASLTQCAQSTFTWTGSASPFYVAVVPSTDPCGSDALAEYYDVTSPSVDYYANLPSGTQCQLYVVDANGAEYWGPMMTVGDGDASCLGSDASVNAASDSSSSSSDSSSSSSTSDSATAAAPTTYTPPYAAAATTPTGSSGSTSNSGTTNDDTGSDAAPANAADDTTSGASTITASATLLVGALAAAVALF